MVLMPDSDGESLTPAGGTAIAERPVDEILAQTPWITIVWDDPVNLMSYVTHVFVAYFHYTKSKAEKLMLQVHTTGKAIVSTEFVKTNWSLGYDQRGQPIPNPAKFPSLAGTLVSPNAGGGARAPDTRPARRFLAC